ncbi:anaphase-promoting complex subunit 10 isoform X2 [Dermacentor silvarum]|uniref:anaphase-promoting complex subunit 10 isoform X2 n=1 Tax=Dermacentor silvarum TaxID=543639 RepID=UPI0021013E7B|nr:anaphase-promoting complex subunit 10 isoform X2 [Dermacentor silvarum]
MNTGYVRDSLSLEREGKVREVGAQAVWSLSSCKPGFGVDQLRDNCLDTYWQSDGPQPHLVNIQFRRKTTIQGICIYADYKLDESYTPNRISVRVGSSFHDLQELEAVDLTEPTGWVHIATRDAAGHPVRTFFVQIAVLSNHQNGRDTHLRQIKVKLDCTTRRPAPDSLASPGMPSQPHLVGNGIHHKSVTTECHLHKRRRLGLECFPCLCLTPGQAGLHHKKTCARLSGSSWYAKSTTSCGRWHPSQVRHY